MRLLDKWKEEWFLRRRASLETQFQLEFDGMTATFNQVKKEHEEKFQSAYLDAKTKYENLKIQQSEIDELSKRLEERKLELAHQNEELKTTLRVLEAKSSPSNVWAEAFTAGFNKAWDMMLPVMVGGINRLKKEIEDKAIQDTLRRMNGDRKTNQ